MIAECILDEIDHPKLIQKYKGIQADIVRRINEECGLDLSASDAFLLAKLSAAAAAQLPADRKELTTRFKRGDWYRFCLTPYFEEYERRG